MTMPKRIPIAATLLGCLLAGAPLASAAPCVVIKAARAHLPEGPAEAVDLRLEGGRIAALGPGLDPAGCTLIEGEGLEVTAGIIAPHTQLGLVEVSQEEDSVDREVGDAAGPIRAAFTPATGYNPRSTLIPVTRAQGVTAAILAPSGGLVSGQGAAVQLAGLTQRASLIEGATGLYVSLGAGEGSRAESLALLVDLLQEARVFTLMKGDWLGGQSRPFQYAPRQLEAVLPALAGEMPLVVSADRASEIEAILGLRAQFKDLKIVINGGAEAHLVKERLAEAGVAVILDPRVYGGGTFDSVAGSAASAGILAQAGVLVMMGGEGTHRVGIERILAGNAVRGGLDHAEAIRSLTQTPAEVFGLEGRGRLEVGALGDVVVWSGDPLEIGTAVRAVFIEGEAQSLSSRHTALLERYRTLPGTPVAPLPLPAPAEGE